MKHKILISLMMSLLLVSSVWAQEIDFQTEEGLSFSHPLKYELTIFSANEFSLSDDEGNEIYIRLDVNESIVPDEVINSIEEFMDAFFDLMEADDISEEDIESDLIELRGGDALLARVTELDGTITLIVFELDDNSLGFIAANPTTADLSILEDEMFRIAESISYPEGFDFFTLDPLTILDDGTDEFVAGSLRPSQMPEGLIVLFSNGINSQIDMPEGWRFTSDDEVSGSAVLINDDNPGAILTIIDFGANSGISQSFLETTYISTAIETVFADLAEGQVVSDTIFTEDNRGIDVVDAFGVEGSDIGLGMYVVALAEDHFGLVQVQGLKAGFPEMISEDMFNLAATFTLDVDESAINLSVPASAVETVVFGEISCAAIAWDFVSESSPSALVQCPAGCGEGTVWGTDIYTNDSTLCAAALHAGALASEGGEVLVEWQPGLDSYTGTERNGISTRDYGAWSNSFTVTTPDGFVLTETKALSFADLELQEGVCTMQGRNVLSSDAPTARVSCPANCTDGVVWGTDIYTDDSNLCASAVHAGVISAEGGIVIVQSFDGQESYTGSERNGISTRDYGNWSRSFIFLEDEGN